MTPLVIIIFFFTTVKILYFRLFIYTRLMADNGAKLASFSTFLPLSKIASKRIQTKLEIFLIGIVFFPKIDIVGW